VHDAMKFKDTEVSKNQTKTEIFITFTPEPSYNRETSPQEVKKGMPDQGTCFSSSLESV
jgi:hypothetical protein